LLTASSKNINSLSLSSRRSHSARIHDSVVGQRVFERMRCRFCWFTILI